MTKLSLLCKLLLWWRLLRGTWPTPWRGLGLLTGRCAVGLFLAGKDRPLRREASRELAGVGDQSSLIRLLSPLRPLGERSRRGSMARQGATLSSATTLKPERAFRRFALAGF